MSSDGPRILVLGVGNILFSDEGVGVRAVQKMESEYEFSDNVNLLDGGTLGTRLIEAITDSDRLVIIDAVLGDAEPGCIYRLTGDDLRKSLSFKNSLHQTDLVDTLIYCELIGNCPEAVVVGIEPMDYNTMSVDLSKEIQDRLPDIISSVQKEIEEAGGWCRKRENVSP